MAETDIPATMRAVVAHALGGPEVLAVEEVPRPAPEPTEVLVRVTAAGLNPADYKSRRHGAPLGQRPPFVLGWDVAGVVEAVGMGVTRFRPGDRVFGMPAFPHLAGAYAEYVTARARHLAPIPAGLPDAEAGALPLSSLTAWQALVETAGVGEGTRVLILAASGGVGHLAVQIAAARGATVLGTAREAHAGWLRDLGAERVIDPATQDVGVEARGADVVLDLVGGAAGHDALPALRDGGLLITVPSGRDAGPLREAAAGRVAVTDFLVEPDRAGMEAIAALVADGRLRPRLARTFPLAQAAAAHAFLESGAAHGGKVVLLP